MYQFPERVGGLLLILFLLWIATIAIAVHKRRRDPEPTWFTYLSVALGVFGIAGAISGLQVYRSYTRPYHVVSELKTVNDLNTGVESGQNLIDAGIITFAPGTGLDPARSWHFKHKTLYCVAPIVHSASLFQHQESFDFWAVGKDCCSIGASDFRCGAWTNPGAKGGFRVFDDDDLNFYRLAVSQAESTFGFEAKHPIFVSWSDDPAVEVNKWGLDGLWTGIRLNLFAFVCSLFFVTLASCRFSWLGRGKSPAAAVYYDRPGYGSMFGGYTGYERPIDYSVHSYYAA